MLSLKTTKNKQQTTSKQQEARNNKATTGQFAWATQRWLWWRPGHINADDVAAK